MKKYVFTLLLAGMMVVMTACGNNMNDATGGNQNDTVNDSTTNDNGMTKDDTMNNDRNNNDRNNNGDGVIGDIGEDIGDGVEDIGEGLKEVNYLFSTIPGVQVMIIAGNHDRIRPSSALMSFTWCPNVTFLMSEELSSVYFRDLNLEVHGFSYHTAEINEARLNGIKAPDDGRIHVLLAHGGDASHLPLDKGSLAHFIRLTS